MFGSLKRKKRVPRAKVEEGMRLWLDVKNRTGKTDDQIMREVIPVAIENGIDVFGQLPDDMRELMELQYPDLAAMSRKRFPNKG